MPSLADQFCPNVHDAPITAATYDPDSGALATADASGLVAVQRPGEATPQLQFQPGVGVQGALALIRGGSYLAVGDDDGRVGVYRTDTGEAVFLEEREGARGRVRAFRGVALSPEGSQLAAISIDGILRWWDLVRGERNSWSGFSGSSVEFDPRGERVLSMDSDGQIRLMDLRNLQALYMDRLQTPAAFARFTRDGTGVVAAGQAGIAVLRVADGALVSSFATRGGSGIMNLALSPDGTMAAAITQRSAHLFALPGLEPIESRHHGAPGPTGAAIWTPAGLRVAGNDGLMHSGGGGSAGPVTAVAAFGEHRAAAHGPTLALWRGNRQSGTFALSAAPRVLEINRDGSLVLCAPERGPVEVWRTADGKRVWEGGPETSGAPEVLLGGSVVAVRLRSGGLRWWDLSTNAGYELKWPTGAALSHGGTWLGVLTPKGAIRIIDPATGRDALPAPVPAADAPVRTLAFVNRRPDLLVLDAEGVLCHYDLSESARGGPPARARDVLTINCAVDRLWGLTGGQHAALRLPEDDRCSIVVVDIQHNEVVHEVANLPRHATLDAESGVILEPARSAAILERELDGRERRVLRALPDGEWISFGRRGILDASAGAGGSIGA